MLDYEYKNGIRKYLYTKVYVCSVKILGVILHLVFTRFLKERYAHKLIKVITIMYMCFFDSSE